MTKLSQHSRQLLIVLISLDTLVLMLHLAFAQHTTFFHLDFEQNLPTVYQSVKAILLGACVVSLAVSRWSHVRYHWFVAPAGLLLIGLGLDELLQLHENSWQVFAHIPWLHHDLIVPLTLSLGFRSSLWMVYYAPLLLLILVWLSYWMYLFWHKNRFYFRWLAVVILSLLLVGITEIISSAGQVTPHTYFWLITIEETAEMIAATLLGVAALSLVIQTKKRQS